MKFKTKLVVPITLCMILILPFFSFKSYSAYMRSFSQKDPFNAQFSQMRKSISPGTILYFSNSGSDANDGLSPSSPKQNPVPYITAGNCQCMLKSGNVFNIRETINVGANVVVSTYGGKSRAGLSFIQTSTDQLKCVDPQNNIYSVSIDPIDPDIGCISIDGTFNRKRLLTPNLVNDNEYYYDRQAHVLSIKSSSDLTGKQVRYTYGGNGLYIIHGENVVVENIEIAGVGRHGISIISESNVLIYNCFIHDIGGCIHDTTGGTKYGNGVQIWASACNNIAVYKNIITDCFDAGITPQVDQNQKNNSSNLYFFNNLIERCNYGFESFHTSTSYTMQNVIASNNIIYDTKDITEGYRFTQSSTDYTSHFCLWDYSNTNSNIIIDHNFAFKSQTSAISYSWKSAVSPPISFSDNTLITSNEPIKNPAQYTGDDSQYLVVQAGSYDYTYYERLAQKLISRYSLKKIIK